MGFVHIESLYFEFILTLRYIDTMATIYLVHFMKNVIMLPMILFPFLFPLSSNKHID